MEDVVKIVSIVAGSVAAFFVAPLIWLIRLEASVRSNTARIIRLEKIADETAKLPIAIARMEERQRETFNDVKELKESLLKKRGRAS